MFIILLFIDFGIDTFISTFKAAIFMSGTQALARVVNLLIKYVTCFNFFKSINQSFVMSLTGIR